MTPALEIYQLVNESCLNQRQNALQVAVRAALNNCLE